MRNYAVDFRLDLMPTTGEDIEYSFRFGKCDDFRTVLATVKLIRWPDRDYDPEDDHRWTVQASLENYEILCEAFCNFADMYKAAKHQLPLPLEWG